MENLGSPRTETTTDAVNDAIDAHESIEKPDFVKQIESFDINNLSPENIEFMSHVIQDVFREKFPVDTEIIDKIPSSMRLIKDEEFVRLRKELGEDAEMDLGFYSLKLNQMLINVSKHHTPSTLFTTMFHESLHFASIQSGAGLSGNFCYPDIGENETAELLDGLGNGVLTMTEGTTQDITQSYVLDYMGFEPHPQMFSYVPERLVMNTIWTPFSVEERTRAYFNTPLESLRVRIENAFEEDYDPDKPTGIFADYLVGIARATEQMRNALDSWNKDGDPKPVEAVLDKIRHAVGLFINREIENGDRKLSEEDKKDLQDYLSNSNEDIESSNNQAKEIGAKVFDAIKLEADDIDFL